LRWPKTINPGFGQGKVGKETLIRPADLVVKRFHLVCVVMHMGDGVTIHPACVLDKKAPCAHQVEKRRAKAVFVQRPGDNLAHGPVNGDGFKLIAAQVYEELEGRVILKAAQLVLE
jgi:hypothetical protein